MQSYAIGYTKINLRRITDLNIVRIVKLIEETWQISLKPWSKQKLHNPQKV